MSNNYENFGGVPVNTVSIGLSMHVTSTYFHFLSYSRAVQLRTGLIERSGNIRWSGGKRGSFRLRSNFGKL